MNVELLKAGFILTASAAFILITFGSRIKIRNLKKVLTKSKTEKSKLMIG